MSYEDMLEQPFPRLATAADSTFLGPGRDSLRR
jgi:hypothetical protein